MFKSFFHLLLHKHGYFIDFESTSVLNLSISSSLCMRFKFYVTSCRVATAQGKQGIWKSIFPDRENTGNLLKNIKNMFLHKEFTTNTGKILRVKKNNELVI